MPNSKTTIIHVHCVFNVNRNMRISQLQFIFASIYTYFYMFLYMFLLLLWLVCLLYVYYKKKKSFYLEINISAVISENPPYVMFANVFPAEDHVTLCKRLHSLWKVFGWFVFICFLSLPEIMSRGVNFYTIIITSRHKLLIKNLKLSDIQFK